jgi:hypothetical protein
VSTQDVMAGKKGHTAQEVPFWLYAPDDVKTQLLHELNIPQNVTADKVRSGNFYDGTVVNKDYTIENSAIAPAIARVVGLLTFEEATATLFSDASSFGSYDENTDTFTFINGEKIGRNQNFWFDQNGIKHSFTFGRGTYINTDSNDFYVPKEFLVNQGYPIPEK